MILAQFNTHYYDNFKPIKWIGLFSCDIFFSRPIACECNGW